MEKAKKTNPNEKSTEQVRNNDDWGSTSCPWWIFADKKSADNDLKEKFEIVEDEKKD